MGGGTESEGGNITVSVLLILSLRKRDDMKVPKSKSLVSLNSDSAKKPTLTRSVSATPINKAPKRTLALTARATSQTTLRSTRSRQASLLSDNQQLSERVASFQIPLPGGQTLSSSLSHLESIDEKLLTEDAVKHIQALVGKLTSLCSKVSPQQPDNRR
ncbi:borealin-2-like [Hyperolius riggenbachi]|uniref:borealin-2-like n=1 Tax=Hyperolius riggenbachi TaxID=752182 RepID=UPI0035A2FE30